MKKILYIIIIAFVSFACDIDEKKYNEGSNFKERLIKRALVNGFYSQIDEHIGVVIYQNKIYYLTSSPESFSEHKFLLHLIKENGSFDNKDFFHNKYLLNDSIKGEFSSIDIIEREINLESYKAIRLGQFKRNKSNTVKMWSKEILISDIEIPKQHYNNQYELVLNKNLLNIAFQDDLDYGKFFKTNSKFYILITLDNIYFITKNENEVREKMMLHLIRNDNSFKNLSFKFQTKEYQQYLELPYQNYKIAKINFSLDKEFERIRIGQFNSNGNIWVKEFKIDEVMANPLLKFENESPLF